MVNPRSSSNMNGTSTPRAPSSEYEPLDVETTTLLRTPSGGAAGDGHGQSSLFDSFTAALRDLRDQHRQSAVHLGLSNDELLAQLEDYSELLAMLDLYSELHPELLAQTQADTERRWRNHFSGSPSHNAAAPTEAPVERAERAQALRVEEVLVGLAKLLHSGGTPTWRFEFNMGVVARGLGLPNTRFGIFPDFVLVSFDRQQGQGHHHGGSTLYINTTPGMNMAKLDAADALARRIASYATNTPSAFKRKPSRSSTASQADCPPSSHAGELECDPELEKATAAALADVPRRLIELREKYTEPGPLAEAILDLASTGPGFYMYSKHVHAAANVEELWDADLVPGSTVHTPRTSHQFSNAPGSNGSGNGLHTTSPSTTVWAGAGALAAMSAHDHGGGDAPAPEPHAHHHRHTHRMSRLERHRQRCATFSVLAVNDALARMHAIENAPPLYPRWSQALAMCISSAGCAPTFFGGSLWDGVVAGLLGLAVGLMGMAAATGKGDRLLRAYEFLAACLCSFVARVIDGCIKHTCMQTVVLSGLIWLVQGWTLTNATVEVATRNPMTGTSHLFTGIIVTALMGFGLDVGNAAAQLLTVPAPSVQDPTVAGSSCSASHMLPLWARVLLFVPVELAFSMLLNARPQQLLPITCLAGVSFLTSTGLDASNHSQLVRLDSFLAAALVSLLGNVYANLTGKPAMALTASAVFILVPGCMALRGVSDVFNGASSVGLSLAGRVLNVAVSIGAGIFLANLCVVPREVTYVTAKALKGPQAPTAATPHHMWRHSREDTIGECGTGQASAKRPKMYTRQVGTHGLIINFVEPGAGMRRSATYLPEIAHREGWTKRYTVESLILKSGYNGGVTEELLGSLAVTRYQSAVLTRTYAQYVASRAKHGVFIEPAVDGVKGASFGRSLFGRQR